MSAAPLAAVVVPVYNAGPYLSACLRSLAAQTHPDWRCYLVDDGSDDGSGALCDQAAREDARFTVLHQAQCRGRPGCAPPRPTARPGSLSAMRTTSATPTCCAC